MEDNRSRYEVKIQKASNGYVARLGHDWFVFKDLKEAFVAIEEFFKKVTQDTKRPPI